MKNLLNLFKSKKQIRIESIQNEIKLFQDEPLNELFTAQYRDDEIKWFKSLLIELN